MRSVQPCDVPMNSFLRTYKDRHGYADCYTVDIPGTFTQEQYVEAFYTSALFKVERSLLRYLASRPASDADAKQLATGKATSFSAWRVESQSASELLLADFTGRTRSWLMVTPSTEPTRTRLYFGSAVVPKAGHGANRPSLGWQFHALLGFHRLYSRFLLGAASGRLGAV